MKRPKPKPLTALACHLYVDPRKEPARAHIDSAPWGLSADADQHAGSGPKPVDMTVTDEPELPVLWCANGTHVFRFGTPRSRFGFLE
jgi:hypothetical protein